MYNLVTRIVFQLIFCSVSVFSLDGAEYSLKVASFSEQEMIIQFQLTKYSISEKTINGQKCNVVFLPHAAYSHPLSFPDLPQISQAFPAHEYEQIRIEVLASEYDELSVYPIVPSRGTISRFQDPEDAAYIFGTIYEKNEWFPDTVAEVSKPINSLRKSDIQSLSIHPFSYNSSMSVLRIYTQLTLSIHFDTRDSDTTISHTLSRRF